MSGAMARATWALRVNGAGGGDRSCKGFSEVLSVNPCKAS